MSGIAPNLEFLVAMRVLQGLGGGPVIPMAQATMWEIFPLRQRGTAMAVWGVGIMMAPILGPTLGGWIVDNWSWRWIFYVNLPIGLLGFFMASVFLFDSPFLKKPRRVDARGLVFMVVGFGALQLMFDQGEKYDWFDSGYIVTLAVVAVVVLTPSWRASCRRRSRSSTSPCSTTATSPSAPSSSPSSGSASTRACSSSRSTRRRCWATTPGRRGSSWPRAAWEP